MLQYFTINKNEHFSYRHKIFGLPLLAKTSFTFKKMLKFTAIFDYSCKYDNVAMGTDGFDINKLYGLQYSWTDHLGSARVGWRYDIATNKIKLFAFVEDNKQFKIDPIGATVTGAVNNFTIAINDNRVSVTYTNAKGENITSVIVIQRKPWKIRFRLWPYFGGNMSAPHKMLITVNEKTT